MRFWLDRGVDGLRIDVAYGLVKANGLPDVANENDVELLAAKTLLFFDQEGVHEIYRRWRRILDSYEGNRLDRFALGLISGSGKTTLERIGDAAKLDLQMGTNRARAAALLMLALPGDAYLYQGEELALPEVRDIPEIRIADPMWRMSGFTDRGRDGCRVPLPWTKDSVAVSVFQRIRHSNPKTRGCPNPLGGEVTQLRASRDFREGELA